MTSGTIKNAHLQWPEEQAGAGNDFFRWSHFGSNICLDFHGDPVSAQLAVFSDGNHHMALRECLDQFSNLHGDLSSIFYATTPPGPIINMLKTGGLQLGNLVINVRPHVFISPPNILDGLVNQGFISSHTPFVRNQGNVLLVRRGNPQNIRQASDIMDPHIRLFLSNPDTEKASYSAYYNTLQAIISAQDSNRDFLEQKLSQDQVIFGQVIHHREAPQAVAEGSADVAVVFYHLALRYIRIFPEHFDMVPLGGTIDDPAPLPGNIISDTSIGLIGDGGVWGEKLLTYLASDKAIQIYRSHGLIPAPSSF